MTTENDDDGLSKKDRQLKRLVGEADVPVLLTMKAGYTALANQHAASMLGYSLEELYELPSIELFHPEERDFVRDRIKRFGRRDVQFPAFTTRLLTKDGLEVPVQFIGLPERWQGRRGFLNFLRDQRLEQRLEEEVQAAQRLQSVGTLAGGVAHDFNNLLMSISGNVSLMLYDIDKTHPHYKPLMEIEEQVRSGARLANELLGYARQGKHKEELIDLRELVEQTSRTFGRTRKDITIHPFRDDDNTYTVMADRDSMERVVLNILINAGDAMPGGGDVFLTIELTDGPGFNAESREFTQRFIHLGVTDTGEGMDEEGLQRAFEPFYTTKERGRSTGLGLSSAYGVVKRHRGYIEIGSPAQKGVTVDIYLPAAGKQDTAGESPEERPTGKEKRAMILLVDDEDSIIKLGERMLNRLGYTVLSAKSGEEAIAIYRKCIDQIDLVILDMIMPGMSGAETWRELKAVNPKVTVLVASGYSESQAKEILVEERNGYMQKPFDMKTLQAKLDEMLG